MNKDSKHWLEDEAEILQSLIADEAKAKAMLVDMENTLRQLKAKSSFRLALLNSLREQQFKSKDEETISSTKSPSKNAKDSIHYHI
jgi:hypothetical protein